MQSVRQPRTPGRSSHARAHEIVCVRRDGEAAAEGLAQSALCARCGFWFRSVCECSIIFLLFRVTPRQRSRSRELAII